MFENKLIRGIHISRFIMSWVRSGGVFDWRYGGYYDFEKWLKSLGLSDEEIGDIMEIAKNGKCELEISAMEFIKNNTGKDSEEEA